MTRSEQIEKLGALGEEIVKGLLAEKHVVEMSDYKYDAIKDMTADDQTVEVKTLVLIKKFESFCLGKKQWKKCDEVDRLFFVRVPESENDHIVVYESENPRSFRSMQYNGDWCRMYPLTNMKIYGTINNNELSKQLCDLSPSKYKGFKYDRTRIDQGTAVMHRPAAS